MDIILEFLKSLHSPEGMGNLIKTGGIVVLAIIIFAETGLLVGFFLPGDSLLITAGIFTSTNGAGGPGILNLWTLLIVLSICAVVARPSSSHALFQFCAPLFHSLPELRR